MCPADPPGDSHRRGLVEVNVTVSTCDCGDAREVDSGRMLMHDIILQHISLALTLMCVE